MKLQHASVLVTGGLGFIGTHLVDSLLARGASVVIIQKKTDKHVPISWANKVRVIDSLVEEFSGYAELLPNVQIIYHLAGSSGAEESMRRPFENLNGNCGTALKLLQACADFNPRIHFIFASSRLVYGKAQSIPVNENHPTHPTSLYGIHKLTVEKYAEVYSHLYGIRSTILRISNPYGPTLYSKKSYGVINWFLDIAKSGGEIPIYGDGRQTRDYIHIDDLISLLLLVPEKDAERIVYNVGSGIGTRMVDVASEIVDLVGRGKIRFVPWSKSGISLETGDYVADISSVVEEYNWRPRLTLRKGLQMCLRPISSPVL